MALGSLEACAHKSSARAPCETPEPLSLRFEAGERLNIGDGGQSLPTTLRVYQLKDDTKLTGASFDDLLERAAETLGDGLLSTDELSIAPKEVVQRQLKRAPGAGAVAIVALFREPAGSFWRVVHRLPPPDPAHCRRATTAQLPLHLEENRLESR